MNKELFEDLEHKQEILLDMLIEGLADHGDANIGELPNKEE